MSDIRLTMTLSPSPGLDVSIAVSVVYEDGHVSYATPVSDRGPTIRYWTSGTFHGWEDHDGYGWRRVKMQSLMLATSLREALVNAGEAGLVAAGIRRPR